MPAPSVTTVEGFRLEATPVHRGDAVHIDLAIYDTVAEEYALRHGRGCNQSREDACQLTATFDEEAWSHLKRWVAMADHRLFRARVDATVDGRERAGAEHLPTVPHHVGLTEHFASGPRWVEPPLIPAELNRVPREAA